MPTKFRLMAKLSSDQYNPKEDSVRRSSLLLDHTLCDCWLREDLKEEGVSDDRD